MIHWYVIETLSHQEQLAEQELRLLDFLEVYFPTIDRIIRHSRRERTVSRPLFPSYLFCRFDLHDPWQRIYRTRGVHRVLGGPTPLSDKVVDEIRTRTAIPISGTHFRVGDRVRVGEGSFSGQEALFVSSARMRVKVLISLLGREWEVELDKQSIQPR